MRTNEREPRPVLRIEVGGTGVLRIEGPTGQKQEAMDLLGRLFPAIRRFDREVRRELA
jgi:hypothetical protein